MKINNLFIVIILLLLVSFHSCQNHSGYIITGNVSGFPDSTMIYLRNLSTDETFDSTLIIGNKFQLKGQLIDEPEQIWLNTEVDNEFIYTDLLIGNEKIKIIGDIKDFPWHVTITGSKTQEDHNYLLNLTKSFYMKRDSLLKIYFTLTPEEQQNKGKEIWDEIGILDESTNEIQVAFVKSHINTYPGVINLGYLKNSIPKDTVQYLYNMLSDELKSSKYAKVVEIYLNDKIFEIGDYYHDFKALDKKGDTISFSSITGKYILLNFTSAYCGPCIQSVKELKLINQTYSDSLQIVSFSTDTQKSTWHKSLEKDSISWISLWDGEGTYSETYIKYGVRGIPSFFLINPKGEIMDKWSGYGKGSLENKLHRFKKN